MGSMRKFRNIFLVGLNALGIGVALATSSAEAQDICEPEDAECACERALEVGTIEALEDYLFRYPDAPTACTALALNTLSQFTPGDRDDSTIPADTSGYGG
jgi:hypothetical protein